MAISLRIVSYCCVIIWLFCVAKSLLKGKCDIDELSINTTGSCQNICVEKFFRIATVLFQCIWMRKVTTVYLTHWGRVTHICVSKLTIIGSDNGLSPDRRQAIIWTNTGISLIGPLGTNFSEILIEILTLSFKKMRLKVSSAKRWPFCLGLNVFK